MEKGEKLLEIPGLVKIEVNEESTLVYFIIPLYTGVSCLSIFIPIVRIEMTADRICYTWIWRSVYDHVDMSVHGRVPLTLLSDGVMKLEMITIKPRHKTK